MAAFKISLRLIESESSCLTVVLFPQMTGGVSLQKFARGILVVQIMKYVSIAIFGQANAIEESDETAASV